jgi:hypothetical protein
MTGAFYARLRHHSLTCFSRTVAYKSPRSLAILPSQSRILQHSRVINSPVAPSPTSLRFFNTTSRTSEKLIMNGANGSPRGKRKQHPGSAAERPQKQHRAVNGKESAGQNTPEVSELFEEDVEMEETRIVPGLADTAEWQATIEKVVRNVVSIRFCQTCSFDTDPALTSEATGFVVDAERG